MLARILNLSLFPLGQALAPSTAPASGASVPIAPSVILILCVLAGIGTVLLLPSRREASIRKIGAVILAASALIFAAVLVRWAAGIAAGQMNAYFWIFSTIALVGAVRVITHTKPVYSALYFVLTVFATAGMFVLMWAEFMAAALVLIYAGAILITYLFVIMLAAEATSPQQARSAMLEHDAVSRDPVVACIVGFGLMALILTVVFDKAAALPRRPGPPTNVPPAVISGSTRSLGAYLFDNQLVNLELAGLILTVAMVGAIVISRKRVEPTLAEYPGAVPVEPTVEIVLGPATPVDDNPHSLPVVGTLNPRQKAYPET
jgi:NADH-quinone oxidoreductase subunit J